MVIYVLVQYILHHFQNCLGDFAFILYFCFVYMVSDCISCLQCMIGFLHHHSRFKDIGYTKRPA